VLVAAFVMVIVISIVGSTYKTIENYRKESLALEIGDNDSKVSYQGNQETLIKIEEIRSRKSSILVIADASECGIDLDKE
jgi:hypothetical protein